MRGLALRRVAVAVCVVAASGAPSCSNSVQADTGADATMHIAGAQFFRGSMPAGSASGPAVMQVKLTSNNIWEGLSNDPIRGALAPTATAAAVALQGDVGYWVVTAGVPSVATPDDPSFAATAAFSTGILVGTSYTLVVCAVDQAGQFGPPTEQTLVAETSPTNPPATGDLVVTLTWDTESNLDLHVVDPAGTEIDSANPSTEPPFAYDQPDGGSWGYIDYDSNANCDIDGLRREDAIWPNTPPSGSYTVRVDTPSLCGQPIAHWTVRVVLEGSPITQASGVALAADTMGTHGLGSGVLALEFTVP